MLGWRSTRWLAAVSGRRGLVAFYRREAAAGAYYERELAIAQKLYGPDHPDVARALEELAGCHYLQRRFGEARAIVEKVVAIDQRALGSEHRLVGSDLDHLALLCDAQGDHEAALAFHRRGLAIDRKALGADNPEYAEHLMNLGQTLRLLGRNQEALATLGEALAIMERGYGAQHQFVGECKSEMAKTLHQLGRTEEAQKVGFLFIGCFVALLPLVIKDIADVPDAFLDVAVTKGATQWQLVRHVLFPVAKAIQQSLAIFEHVFGRDYKDAYDELLLLGQIELEQGAPGPAAAVLERARTLAANPDADPSDRAEIDFTLARALVAEHENLERARELARAARPALAKDKQRRRQLSELDRWLRRQGWPAE